MTLPPIIRLMRPGDWTKNAFVLPAFVFSLPAMLSDARAAVAVDAGAADAFEPVLVAVVRTAVAFACFCALASGFYCLNDVRDAPHDREHPVKRLRPIASGAVSPSTGVAVGLVLIAVALGVSATLDLRLAAVLGSYAVLQVLYNLVLKYVMLVDVVTLAIGFALRSTAGAVAIDVRISVWLLLCVFFLTLYLGFIKRLCDLSSAAAAGDHAWRSRAGYDDRIELNWLLGVSAVLAITTYLMYTLSDHAWILFGSRAVGFALLSPLVLISIHRFYRRASRGRSDSPLSALKDDRVVLAAIICFGTGTLTTLLVPGVPELLDGIFMAGMDGGAADAASDAASGASAPE